MRMLIMTVALMGCGRTSEPAEVTAELHDVAERGDDVAPELPAPDVVALAPAPRADASAPVSDATPVPRPDAPPADADPPATEEVVSDELPTPPWLPAPLLERLSSGAPGCVAISRSGRLVLSIVGSDPRELRLADLSRPEGGKAELSWPLSGGLKAALAAALRDRRLAEAAAGSTWLGCEAVQERGAFVIPKAVPVRVSSDGRRAQVAIEGNRPVDVDLRREGGAPWVVAGAYYGAELGGVYLRLSAAGPELALESIGAVELGQSLCVPRPPGKQAASGEAPAFDPAPREVSCVAMSADGKRAAFKTWYRSRGERRDVPNAIQWFGPGAEAEVDLGCLARRCSPAAQAALAAAAGLNGLVGCAIAKGAVAIDGRLVPFVYTKHLLRLQGGSGWRTVHELADGPEVLESLWKVFQHPAGGPIFLYVGRDDGEGEGPVVHVLDEAALGLCPKPPEGTLEVSEVRVSGAARDRSGYKLGGSQLVDGDPSTAWQPGVATGGESAWVELVLDAESTLTSLEIMNGFQRKDGNGDLFTSYARAAAVVITFPDGSHEEATLPAEARAVQRVSFAPRRAASVKLTLAGLHPGTTWSDEVAISELRVIGE